MRFKLVKTQLNHISILSEDVCPLIQKYKNSNMEVYNLLRITTLVELNFYT